MVRNVWFKVVGSPRSTRMPRRIVPASTAGRVSTGTTGLTHRSSSAPCSRATDAWSVFKSTPSTQYRPSISTGG
jgi:hypothetical protein